MTTVSPTWHWLSLLQKSPGERYQSPKELIGALDAYEKGEREKDAAKPPEMRRRTRRRRRR